MWTKHPENLKRLIKFIYRLDYFANNELELYTEMGTFSQVDKHTIKSGDLTFKSTSDLGVVAAGNFLDKRVNWYDPFYIS